MANKANEHAPKTIEELQEMREGITENMAGVLEHLGIDYLNDHNTEGTPKRIAKMFVDEVFRGRHEPMPPVTTFPNISNLDEIYSVGGIAFRSTCSHHFAPILGHVWISVKPRDTLIGLSKFSRITDWYMSRPHIQEEAIQGLADIFEELIQPEGIAITMKANHHCMLWRGVKEHDTSMVNTVIRGSFLTHPHQKAEHYEIIKSQGF